MAKKKIKTNALRHLEAQQIVFHTTEYRWDEETLSAVDAARDLGVAPDEIYKTLVLTGTTTPYLVAVIPGDATLDLKKLAKISGNKKVDMLPMKELESLTGYVHGGCSPIGMKKKFPTFYFENMLSLSEVRVSAGKRGLQLVIDPSYLVEVTDGILGDIIK